MGGVVVAMSGGEERAGGTDDMREGGQGAKDSGMPARSRFICGVNSLGLPPIRPERDVTYL